MRALKNLLITLFVFSIYDSKDNTLGFARVVSDQVVFSYLMDFFVLEEHQGNGIGTILIKHIVEHPDLQVRLWFLATKSSHKLYEKFGFSSLDNPDRFMFKRDENYL